MYKSASPTQFFYDISDDTIDVSQILEYEKQLPAINGAKSICSQNVHQHSMVGIHDTPSIPKWWIDELSCKIVSFITQNDVDYGKDLDPSSSSPSISKPRFIEQSNIIDKWGGNMCIFDCTPSTCQYILGQPVTCPYQ